jgi:hypothetical protein
MEASSAGCRRRRMLLGGPFPAPLRRSGSRGCPNWRAGRSILDCTHSPAGDGLGCPSSDGEYRDRDAQSQLRLLRGEDGRKEEPDRQDEARSAGMKMKADFLGCLCGSRERQPIAKAEVSTRFRRALTPTRSTAPASTPSRTSLASKQRRQPQRKPIGSRITMTGVLKGATQPSFDAEASAPAILTLRIDCDVEVQIG